MENYEQLGFFYLGKEKANEPGQAEPLLLYPSADLNTHALCVGMTGSGKTGLGIDLLEEAAIDGIPCLIIDPKGDMGNLALSFDSYRPENFLPWVSEAEARQEGLSREAYAEQLAKRWQEGTSAWGQTAERVKLLRQNADICIYTPASTAAEPLSLLAGLDAPGPELLQDFATMSNLVAGTVSSLLSLVEIEADPLQSREHILLSHILQQAWYQGQNLDLAQLIKLIQRPPFTTVGVLELEDFYPAAERQKLVQSFNNLLASPGFAPWLQGQPLDIDRLLYNEQGKAKLSIISIAHLGEKERMFFVSFFLNRLLAWTRSQTGSQSLRAILYMDEIFGYFPPVANPPSKRPLLTLLKQARAYGLGIVLSTQNPMDLDYKGLGNIGTWWIGRLQTENDRNRLLDGMQDVVTASGESFSRAELDRMIAGLGKREFIMNNVSRRELTLYESRFALSYLKGPMSLAELQQAKEMGLYTAPAREQVSSAPAWLSNASSQTGTSGTPGLDLDQVKTPNLEVRPANILAGQAAASTIAGVAHSAQEILEEVPKGVSSYFIPADSRVSSYRPVLAALSQTTFYDKETGEAETINELRLAQCQDGPLPIRWDDSQLTDLDVDDLLPYPENPDAELRELPAALKDKAAYKEWERDLIDYLYRNQRLTRYTNRRKARSRSGESERDFRIRLDQESREERAIALDALRAKYEKRLATQEEKIRKASQQVDQRAARQDDAKRQTAISVASSVLGALMGGKVLSSGNLGRATTASRSASRVNRLGEEVERAEESVAKYRADYDALVQEMQEELQNLETSLKRDYLEVSEVEQKPLKRDIRVPFLAILWQPE
jgi:hypothetical protein